MNDFDGNFFVKVCMTQVQGHLGAYPETFREGFFSSMDGKI